MRMVLFQGVRKRGMDVGEEPLRHQAVAGHGQEDARGAQHHDQQHRGDAGHAGGGDDDLGPAQARSA